MTVDLAIIGAGPAGMAAAIEARACGLSVLVADENAAPGGQVFRAAEAAARDPAVGPEIAPGLPLIEAFRASGAAYRPATTLWHLDPEAGRAQPVRRRRRPRPSPRGASSSPPARRNGRCRSPAGRCPA